MIDHHTLETASSLVAIATLGGIVIFSMRGPKRRDLDAEGHVMDFDRDPPTRQWEVKTPAPLTAAEFDREYKIEFPDAPPVGIVLDPRTGLPKLRDPDHPKMRHAEMAARLEADALRFFVGAKADRAGFWRIRDRANFREVPGKLYTERKSALRAARRLNAKAEIEAAK